MQPADLGGRVWLRGLIASVQRDGFVGGPLERAISLPAARRRDYVVQSPTWMSPARTMVVFTAAPVEWRMPWARPATEVSF
jgi:hypothetical protein